MHVHSAGELAGRGYLVYELVSGARTLSAVFEAEGPVEERVELVRQVG